jgi:hypothetical protein
MPIISTELFDFYQSGDLVNITFKGTLTQVGYTVYDHALKDMILSGYHYNQKTTNILSFIVEKWTAIESTIVQKGLPCTKQIIQSLFNGVVLSTSPNNVTSNCIDEDHEELSYG